MNSVFKALRAAISTTQTFAFRLCVILTSELPADLRYGAKALAATPGFTSLAVVCLTLGSAVTTLMIGELNSTVLRPLPGVQQPGRLAVLNMPVSYFEFLRYRDHNDIFSGVVAATSAIPFSIVTSGTPERVSGEIVSSGYFSVLGVPPVTGRTFLSENENRSSSPPVVLSYGIWRRLFGSNPGVVGQAVSINGRPCTVIGVASKTFRGDFPFFSRPDIWVLAASDGFMAPGLGIEPLIQRDTAAFRLMIRLAPGVAFETASAAVSTVASPQTRPGERRPLVRLIPAGMIVPLRREDILKVTALPGFLVGLVLLISCGNVATILVARGAKRQREIAVRIALGAGRWRVVRQLLAENSLIAMAASALALLLTSVLARLIGTLNVQGMELSFGVDLRVLGLALILSVLTTIIFGLTPALYATKSDLIPALKGQIWTPARRYRRFGLRNQLVLYQLAASLVLLAVTGFIVRGFQRQNEIDLGFQPNGVYMLSVDPGRDGYSAKQSRVFLDQLLQKARELPGIRSASLTETVPLRLSNGRTISLQPRDGSQAGQSSTMLSTVGPGYFETLGIPIRKGRAFRGEDTVGRSSAIINETLARDLWPGRTAVGNVIRAGDHDYEVVGVVADGKYGIILESRQRCVYLPMPWNPYEGQSPPDGITLLVRAAPGFWNVLPALQEVARNSVESERPSELIGYATAAPFAIGFLETALAIEDNNIGIWR